MLDANPAPPPARHVRGTLAAQVIGALGLLLALVCLAVVADTIVFWSSR